MAASTSDMRAIVDALKKPPFERSINLIEFDSLEPIQLLQLLNDVLAKIAPDHDLDIREENPEDTVVRLLSLLRVVRYKPTVTGSAFREGLVQGGREVIHPILAWLLPRIDELKKRAYLSRFLMPIDVPPDILQDEEVDTENKRCKQLMEEFKDVHKRVEELRGSGFSTGEIKRDIEHMEQEKQQLKRRIARMQQKLEGVSGFESLLEAARYLRKEQTREEDLERHRVDQENQLALAEERLQRAMDKLKDARSKSIVGGVQELLSRTAENVRMNTYLAEEKLPASIQEKSQIVYSLRQVADAPALDDNDLDKLSRRVQELTSEGNRLMEERVNQAGGSDENLSMFRKQAVLLTHKKSSLAEKLKDLQDRHSELQESHKRRNKERGGVRVPKEQELVKYVAKLRGLSVKYKDKKQQLDAMENEASVLEDTNMILMQKRQIAEGALTEDMKRRGIHGYDEAQENLEEVSAAKGSLDEVKGQTLQDISEMVEELTKTIESKKTSLAPRIKELRTLREQASKVEAEYNEAKEAFDAEHQKLNSTTARLKTDVQQFRDTVAKHESDYHRVQLEIRNLSNKQAELRKEMQIYVGQEAGPSKRDLLQRSIQEQEVLGTALRDREKQIQGSHDEKVHQKHLWESVHAILSAKLAVKAAVPGALDGGARGSAATQEDVLVL